MTYSGVLFRAARYLENNQLKDLPPGVFFYSVLLSYKLTDRDVRHK